MRHGDGFSKGNSDLVSIHASVKDATSLTFSFLSDNPVSIHASVKDATSIVPRSLHFQQFQSTHL